jgi:hypothetical protein
MARVYRIYKVVIEGCNQNCQHYRHAPGDSRAVCYHRSWWQDGYTVSRNLRESEEGKDGYPVWCPLEVVS